MGEDREEIKSIEREKKKGETIRKRGSAGRKRI